jgi:hypothetical protein
MYLESEAVLRTMLDLQDRGIPSLSVHDGILVPRDSEALAKVTLGACLSNRRILLAREARVRFCLAHEQDIPPLEDR